MNKNLHTEFANTGFIKRSRITAYFFAAFLISLIQVLEDFADNDSSPTEMVSQFFLTLLVMGIILPSTGKLFRIVRAKWGGKQHPAKWSYRSFLMPSIAGLAIISVFMIFPIYIAESVEMAEDIWLMGVSVIIIIAIVTALETFWQMLEKRQLLEITNERLLRNREMSKYQALMNQLNPHFLFNSLNVLSYLVYKDQKSAEQFIEELSKIYRYVLQLNDTYIVPLKKELDFIESYMYLQKIRYQNNLTYELNVTADAYRKFIPPLTLEVLFENAIKHNIIDTDQPLRIKLYTENGSLFVKNNLQPRETQKIASNRIGLNNLIEKFQILESTIPQFEIKDEHFVAQIPLLNSEL